MIKILSIISIAFLLTSCKAQSVGERLSSTSVSIYNNSNNMSSILLGNEVKLDTFKLKEKEVWLSPSFDFDPIFKMQTQSHIVTYQLRLNNSYMIFWNKRRKYWDLKKIAKRQ